MTESELWAYHFWHKFRNPIPTLNYKTFIRLKFKLLGTQSKRICFGLTKTVLEVLNDIEVRRADSPDGVKIAELFFSMFIINVINLKFSIILVFFFFFFRSIICNDKALYLKFLTYILVPVITTLFGVLWGTFSTRREPSMADTSRREPKIKKQYRNYIS
jgi:hypothetical protein